MEHAKAVEIANRLERELTPFVEWIEIAGSIRRLKPDVGDIELVAIPKMMPSYNLFGEKVGEHSLLNNIAVFERIGSIIKHGPRYVQVALNDGINLDLFVVLPPAQLAVILAIRTGPADFSKWLVTPRSKGGALHNGWRCEDGRVWDGQTTMKFVDEWAFFKWMEIVDMIIPQKRVAQWGKFRRDYHG